MNLQLLAECFSIGKMADLSGIDLQTRFLFLARTDEECSFLCPSDCVPSDSTELSDDWRALRVSGTLDFSLTGILAGLASTLAEAGISLFAVSTFNTDYLLVRETSLQQALTALRQAGHHIDLLD